MDTTALQAEFRNRVSDKIRIEPEGRGRFAILTPFRFEDGDHYDIFLKQQSDGRWIITDEASTLMHLSYWMDEKRIDQSGNRQELVSNALSVFSVENREGELVIPIADDGYGDALFNFIQALTKVADVSYLSRERVISTFMEDFRQFMRENVPDDRLVFNWNDPKNDPNNRYPVDARVNSMKRPLVVFALPNPEKVNLATINLLMFEKWDIPFQSMGIYDAMENMDSKPVARFADVVEKSYSSLQGNKKRISEYLRRKMHDTE